MIGSQFKHLTFSLSTFSCVSFFLSFFLSFFRIVPRHIKHLLIFRMVYNSFSCVRSVYQIKIDIKTYLSGIYLSIYLIPLRSIYLSIYLSIYGCSNLSIYQIPLSSIGVCMYVCMYVSIYLSNSIKFYLF